MYVGFIYGCKFKADTFCMWIYKCIYSLYSTEVHTLFYTQEATEL